ncbi:DNA-directed RNA polymerase III subunit RPC3 [Daktulosphaira vitifoliae]|uniref:DNA-directed RNA polymerase III subunit RPC3 n=1 Tax=Daktulosphaira vitifoliae TaxID=58002 RepID=UPI0021AA7B43|nr:DNA-directed RNA polymerase III subunit RPC3 [Daktulosphaira vitifoliae]
MSSDYCRICSFILRDYFGQDVSEIAKPLQWGQKSFTTLSTILAEKYSKCMVQETLLVLLQFDFISAICNVHSIQIEYKLNMYNILLMLRYPKYVSIIKRKFSSIHTELVQTLLCIGRASLSNIVLTCLKMHNIPDDAFDKYWEKGVELIKYEYFKRVPTYVVWTEVKLNKMFTPPTKNHIDEKKILYAPNFNKFHLDIRNKMIIDAVVRTFDDTIIGEVMKTILSQCNDNLSPVSNPIPLQLIRSNLNVGNNYLLEYITMIEEDPTKFLCKSYGAMCNITVNFKQIINCLNDSIIDQIVSYKFGESSARLFRATRANKLLELERLQQAALIPDRETKTLTSELFMNNYLQVQELKKPNTRIGRNDGKSFYLYHLNDRQLHQELTEEVLKMIGNCMVWKFKTCEDNRRLLKNKARFDGMVQGLQDKQEADKDFFEEAMDNLFSPSERILLDSIGRLLRKCQLSIMRLDECLFLFYIYKHFKEINESNK